MTDLVRLRPVTEADLDPLEEMFADPEAIGVFNWDGFRTLGDWRRKFAENGLLGGDRWVLMLEAPDGERAGFISWRPGRAGSAHQYWEIGLSLWPEFRGRGYGTDAQRQVVRYLFAHTPFNRIQALTEVDNIAEQRALEKAGFTREGVLRGTFFRAGTWRDEVIYSVLRAEFPLD
jgi:RimJ/RimL family protein N-acetyltransferase